VTDLTMPGMTGLELVEQIHALRPDLPVIVTTGYGGEQARLRLTAAGGCGDVLSKPFSLDALGEAVHRVVGAAAPSADAP
jgi:CheY-like chemotaxis protein